MATGLASFLQISDLHLGHVDRANLTGPYNAEMPAQWAKCKLFRGLFGHHYLALEQLVRFVNEQRQTDKTLKLLVTGDLTSCGHPDQFETAKSFLGGTLVHPKGLCGLGDGNWNPWAISGNHDQWPGDGRVGGAPSGALRGCFPVMPRCWTLNLPTGHVIRFYSIDTDKDVRPNGSFRRLAIGHFPSQLADATRSFTSNREPKEIRVLLLHHSRRFGRPNYFKPLVMSMNSRRELDQFLVQHGISVMLCGHTHVPRVRAHSAQAPNRQAKNVLECCCGTTTQWDWIPYQWTNLWGSFPTFSMEPNTLILHRITQDGGKLFWEARVHRRAPHGFVPQAPAPLPFQIWP